MMRKEQERYPGERRTLALFLGEILPVVEAELGRDSLLYHGIRRALQRQSLSALRHARALFNHLPRGLRRRISDGLLARTRANGTRREEGDDGELRPMICFEAAEDGKGIPPGRIKLAPMETGADVSVLVRSGTLPRAAAARLREIADWIEEDRRLLSPRYWATRVLEDGGDAERHPGSRP